MKQTQLANGFASVSNNPRRLGESESGMHEHKHMPTEMFGYSPPAIGPPRPYRTSKQLAQVTGQRLSTRLFTPNLLATGQLPTLRA